ncbi:diguanylate cyclase [Paucibacter sp. AS339]|uniref:ligand-binding sensor domain-containing protein n=1 Tax=Paucibacter hankyongi TaxID=3133434 RepID=UPI00309CB174
MSNFARLLACLMVWVWSLGQAWAKPADPPISQDSLRGLAEPRFESVGAGIIPRDVVASLAQDRAGFIWIGTGDGLVRHDAYHFRPQERASARPAARNLGWLRAILPGRDGRLWIGSETDGLLVYDPLTEQVSHLNPERRSPDRAGPPPAPLATVRALAEDRDGAIWVGTLGAGLDRFNPTNGEFQHHRHAKQAGSLDDDRVQALLADSQGTLWVGTWSGLSRRIKGSDRFEPVLSELAGQTVQAIFEASDGRIWVGTQQGKLAVLDPDSLRGTLLADAALQRGASGRGAVNSIVEVAGGQIWVGHAAGIDVHQVRSTELLRPLRHRPGRSAGLAGDEVVQLLVDRAGWVWVGGFGLGLQRHNPANQSIWVREADQAPASPLRSADVRSLLQLDNGEIWAATHGGDVARLDPALRVIGALRPQPQGAPKDRSAVALLQATRITAMVQVGSKDLAESKGQGAEAGTIWLGAESLLYQYDRAGRQLRTLPHGGGQTRRLLVGSEGSLWIGAADGLYRLAPGAERTERVIQGDGQALSGEIHVMAEALDHSLWVGSMKGLFRIPPGAQHLEALQAQAGAELGNPVVLGLLFDSRQTLWVDTAVAGLHRMKTWDGERASFERISERHGIVNRPYGANLLEDRRGRIWTQMHVYDPVSGRLDYLTATDGIDIGTPWFFSFTKTQDGRMLFGGAKGVAVVEPERFDRPAHAPPLAVAELRVNGERQQAGPMQNGLLLRPEQRSFSVEFAVLDFSMAGSSRYAYRLQGFDPDWIETGADLRVASYSNLSPGDYLLRVRAQNRSGVASEQELAIAVKVLPAWWQQWWFSIALLIVSGALIFGLVQLRTRQLRARQGWLERKVRERTAALEEASLSDPLTGLRNRRFLTQHIEADVSLSLLRYQAGGARAMAGQQDAKAVDGADLLFFLLDIDHFKQINDQFGHAAGDAVLQQMRGRLQQVFRESDYLLRWGGEEFLIVARDSTRAQAADLAARACAVVSEQPFQLDDGRLLSKTCSVGFACYPLAPDAPAALDWSTVIDLADAALYQVKRGGRNGWLGAIACSGSDVASLQRAAHQPWSQWAESGGLQVAGSWVPSAAAD